MNKTLGTVVAGLAALSMSVGCSDNTDATSAARNAGWTDVRVTDSSYINFTCSEGEKAYAISGNNPQGVKTSATVCCGHTTIMKGCTIRY